MIVRVDEHQIKAERARNKRQAESRRRRVARGLPPERQPGEGPQHDDSDDAGDYDGVEAETLSQWHPWDESSGPGGGRGRSDDKKGDGKNGGQRRGLFRRRKVCKFCADKIDDINYKDVKLLSGFVPERGKVLPRRISGTCAKHQRGLRIAIVRARQLALLPYASD